MTAAAAPPLAALADRLTAIDPAERPASAEDARALLGATPVATAPTEPLPASPSTPATTPGATEPPPGTAPGQPRSRQIEISAARVLALLAAVGLGIALAFLALGGGGSDEPARQSAPQAAEPSTDTTTTTATSTVEATTEEVPPPAGPKKSHGGVPAVHGAGGPEGEPRGKAKGH